MSTSRKPSSTYSRSSFDVMESTRRLSDGIAEHGSQEQFCTNNTDNGVLGDDLYRSLRLQNFNATKDTPNDGYGEHTAPNIKDKHVDSRKDSSSTSNEGGGFTSSSLGSVAKERSSDDNKDSKGYSDDNNLVADDEAGNDDNDDNADQRSESDSDLESPDDFHNSYAQFQTFERMETMVVITDRDEDGDLRNEPKDGHQSINGQDLTNRIIARSHIITSSDIENSANHDSSRPSITQLCNKLPTEDNESDISHNNNNDNKTEVEAGDFELYSPRTSNPDSTINTDEISSKIHNNANVLEHIEKLDEVKDIGFGNMNKLQHMDRSDPALRRLFMRPRVSPAETQSVKVDPDIKGMVNEFLKTNVAENFIITRVLRENYALFYAWLASHMQTERNAWTVRLGQALENAEKERKGSLETKNLVVEAATKLQTLCRTVSGSLYGVQDERNYQKQNVFRKGPSLRHGQVKGFTNNNNSSSKGGGGAKRASGNDHCFDRINDNKCTLTVTDSQCVVSDNDMDVSMLRQSSLNMIEVSQPDNYESDPGTGKSYYDMKRRLKSHTNNHTKTNNLLKQSGNNNYSQRNQKIKSSNLNSPTNVKPEPESMPSGYTINGTVVEYDECTDWNQVLTDSIDVLVEICDTFLTDRRACLRLISSKSSQYESLVDALSNFIQDSQSRDYFKRKEIEKRLRILEMENKNMQEEMSIMKKTLLDKSEDALNLQTHLSQLEAAVKSQKAEKVDKCVGTKRDEYGSPRIHLAIGKHGKTSKSKSPNFGGVNDNQKQNKSYKIIKSPYATHDPPVINGKAPSKPLANSKPALRNGYLSDASESGCENMTTNNDNTSEVDEPPLGVQRQQSFIEISEEKLEKLKHRAKKLEDSLHDAISSMNTLNRSSPWMDKLQINTDKPAPISHIQKVKAAGNHHQTAKNIAYWNKSSFQVKNNNSHRQRFIGTITKPGFDPYRKFKDPNPSEMEINLRTENSSLLEGRSLVEPRSNNKEHNYPVSNFKLVSDRSQGLTPRSTASRFDGYHSDDDRASNKTQQQMSPQNELSARSETQHKVRARRGQVKQIVSKCLRCQKLFTPTDNHKLACCYHTKDKERLEHYDHMGMLVKVIYAWKCCHQPQEADGCSFGKHV